MKYRIFLFVSLSVWIFSCQSKLDKTEDKESIPPEFTSQLTTKKSIAAKTMMVSAANPHATKAGLAILKKGGSAADAAIAVQLVLNLVEPQSSGIGGGLFLLYYDKAKNKIVAIDGRETAPQKIDSKVFLKPNGKPMKFFDALVGGKSVGTPGVLKALKLLHGKYGKLPWKDLFEPAIELAEQGFLVSPRLNDAISRLDYLNKSPTARKYFYESDGKTPKAIGSNLKNKAFAKTLKKIAANGVAPFYEGSIAKDIIQAIKTAYVDPGSLELDDLKAYKAKEREPICLMYRVYKLCGMPPPTSGGVTVMQILGILENFDLNQLKIGLVEAIHLFSEASKLAYADRARYIADADFVSVPVKALLDKHYLKNRAKLIQKSNMGKAIAGNPSNESSVMADDQSLEYPSTTHFSIVDAQGNAIALTSSIEYGFGSTLMVDGFLLNNQLTDFSFLDEVDGKKVANRIQPGKRPRSSMSPMLIFDKDDKLKMVIGSPGGSRIISYVAQTIVNVLDGEMDIQGAISAPHYVNRNSGLELEKVTNLVEFSDSLHKKGHEVKVVDHNSGLHGIVVTNEGLVGGADPRREGIVLGE